MARNGSGGLLCVLRNNETRPRSGFSSWCKSEIFGKALSRPPIQRRDSLLAGVMTKPNGTVYLVIARTGDGKRYIPERDEADCDLETTLRQLVEGQFDNWIEIWAIDLQEGWAANVTEDVTREMVKRQMMADEVVS